MLPTDGRELLAAWELPATAFDTESVKVSRCIIGTHRVEILDSMPIRDWSLNDTAAQYGPGKYRISPGPGQYSTKSVTMEVSEEFARRAGWATAPPPMPSASEQMAVRTIAKAQEGPVSRLELEQMMETVINKMKPPAPPAEDAFAMMMRGITFYQSIQEQAIKGVQAVGIGVPAAPRSIGDFLVEAAPQILDMVKTVVPAIVAAANRPTTQPQHPAPQVQTITTTGAPAMPQQVTAPTAAAPQLTPEEIKEISPIVAIMRPYAGILAHQTKSAPPEELAAQLSGMIGPDLEESVVALARATRKHGPAVLAHIGHDLATPEAAAVVYHLSDMIEREQVEE